MRPSCAPRTLIRPACRGTFSASGDGSFYRVVGVLAEFERNLSRRRTRTAQAAARRRGRKPGRKKKLNEQHLEQARTLPRDGKMTVAAVAALKYLPPPCTVRCPVDEAALLDRKSALRSRGGIRRCKLSGISC